MGPVRRLARAWLGVDSRVRFAAEATATLELIFASIIGVWVWQVGWVPSGREFAGGICLFLVVMGVRWLSGMNRPWEHRPLKTRDFRWLGLDVEPRIDEVEKIAEYEQEEDRARRRERERQTAPRPWTPTPRRPKRSRQRSRRRF